MFWGEGKKKEKRKKGRMGKNWIEYNVFFVLDDKLKVKVGWVFEDFLNFFYVF